MITLKEQKSDQIIDVISFPKESEAYPEGARIKTTFFWPEREEEPYDFCTPNKLYMFKISRDVYPEQFWVEIFAYQLGCLMGIPVPPAFVAFDSKENKAGSLIEWFYNPKEDLYTRGGDIMQSIINDYDIKKGQKHNFLSILDFLMRLNGTEKCWVKQWAKIIIFDALIGNTDRHQGNWGIVFEKGRQHEQISDIFKNPLVRMSPAFDNGTSMGHEIYEKNFQKFDKESYIRRGKPHLKWNLDQEYKLRENFEAFIKRMVNTFPYSKEIMINCLQFTEEQVNNIFNRLANFEINPKLSKVREKFMLDLLLRRQEQLLSVLGNKL